LRQHRKPKHCPDNQGDRAAVLPQLELERAFIR
jgi:hypothetical protein